MDNQFQENVAQPLQKTPSIEQPLAQQTTKKSNWGVWLILLLILVTIVGAGTYYFMHKSISNQYTASKNNPLPTTATTSTPTVQPTTASNNLNPNTGNLYTDIKDRLDQVIK